MSELDRGRLAERAPRRAEQAPGGETHGTEPARPTGVMPSQPPTSPRNTNRASRPASARSPLTLRACWVTHPASGCSVTPVIHTRRRPSSMNNSTYSRRNSTVSTVKKSVATI